MRAAKARFCSDSSTATPSRFMAQDCRRHLLDDDGGEALRRLVEQHRARIAHQGAGDGQHLLLAAGHLASAAGRASRRGSERSRTAALGVHGRAPAARRLAADLEILGDGQIGEDAPLLRHVAETEAGDAVRRQRAMSWPSKARRSAPRATSPMMAFSVVDLPAPLRPTSAATSPRAKRQRHAEQHLGLAVAGGEALHIEQRRRSWRRLARQSRSASSAAACRCRRDRPACTSGSARTSAGVPRATISPRTSTRMRSA